MATTEQLPEWIAVNTRRRRALIGTLLGALIVHGLVYFNQRAMFMPWNEAEHPLVATTPSAFFAQTSAAAATPGPTAGGATTAFAPAPAIAFGPPAGTPAAGADVGEVVSDAAVAGLADPLPFTGVGGEGDGGSAGDAAVGTPGSTTGGTPAAAGAPIAFVGPTSVPEMSTWAMLLLGFGVIGAVIRQGGWARKQADPA